MKNKAGWRGGGDNIIMNEEDDEDANKFFIRFNRRKKGYEATVLWFIIAVIATIMISASYIHMWFPFVTGKAELCEAILEDVNKINNEYYGIYKHEDSCITGKNRYTSQDMIPSKITVVKTESGIKLLKSWYTVFLIPAAWICDMLSFYSDREAEKKAKEEEERRKEIKRRRMEKRLNYRKV